MAFRSLTEKVFQRASTSDGMKLSLAAPKHGKSPYQKLATYAIGAVGLFLLYRLLFAVTPSDAELRAPEPLVSSADLASETASAEASSGSKLADRIHASILGSFVADAFSLSYHWIYEPADIPNPLPPRLLAPRANFHAKKNKGDFTHEGDQQVILLDNIEQSLHSSREFDVIDYSKRFQELFVDSYKGWFTQATKQVLSQLKNQKDVASVGSSKDDTNPVGRISPLLILSTHDEDGFVENAQRMTAFTHRAPSVVAAAEFFARTLFRTVHGEGRPTVIMTALLDDPRFAAQAELRTAIKRGLSSAKAETIPQLKSFGLDCKIVSGAAGAAHLIAKFESSRSLHDMFAANVGAGGDSSARGMVAGMILAGYHGPSSIPAYAKEMNQFEAVEASLKHLLNHLRK